MDKRMRVEPCTRSRFGQPLLLRCSCHLGDVPQPRSAAAVLLLDGDQAAQLIQQGIHQGDLTFRWVVLRHISAPNEGNGAGLVCQPTIITAT